MCDRKITVLKLKCFFEKLIISNNIVEKIALWHSFYLEYIGKYITLNLILKTRLISFKI